VAKGINIGVASDTRDFAKGIKTGVIDPLEDASEVLEDLARDGDKAGDKLERSMRDAQRDTEKLSDEYRDLGRQIQETGRKGRDLGDGVKSGTDKAGEGLDEFKDEANSTAREAAASFDGSAESIGDAFQEVAANAFAGFGPAGAAAGIAAAIGIGVVIQKINEGTEDSEAFRQKVGELATELIETGREGGPGIDYIVDRLKDLATSAEEGDENLSDLADAADIAGRNYRKLAQAYAGNVDGLSDLVDGEKEYLEQLEHQQQLIDSGALDGDLNAIIEKIEAQKRIVSGLEESEKAAEDAAAAEQAYAAAGGPELEAKAERIDTIQDALNDAIGAYTDFEATEEKAADPQGYIDAMQARIDATTNFNSNVNLLAEKFQLSTDEVQAILDQGVDFGPMLQSIIDSGLDAEFIAKIQAAVGGGEEIVAGANLDASVEVDADTSAADEAIDKTAAKESENTVEVKADTKQAEEDIQAVADGTYTAKIGTSVDTSAASTALYNFASKKRTVTLQAEIVDRQGQKVY